MNKIIKKMLDKYYIDKLTNEIRESCIFKYDLDFRVTDDANNKKVYLAVKKRKYKEAEYATIFTFGYDDALIMLIKLNDVKQMVNDYIKDYLERERLI